MDSAQATVAWLLQCYLCMLANCLGLRGGLHDGPGCKPVTIRPQSISEIKREIEEYRRERHLGT